MLRQHTVAICCLLAATVLRNVSLLFALQRDSSIHQYWGDRHACASHIGGHKAKFWYV